MNGNDVDAENAIKTKQEACGGCELKNHQSSRKSEKSVESGKKVKTDEVQNGKKSDSAPISRGPDIPENNPRSGNVDDVDYMVTKNGGEHNTHKFDVVKNETRLVVRRGREMELKLKVSGSTNGLILTVEFDMAPKYQPNVSMGTKATFTIEQQLKQDRWSAWEKKESEGWKYIGVQIPVDAPVGRWKLTAGSFKAPKDFYVLFNPSHEDDPVYLKDEKQLEEYVFREDGSMRTGTKSETRTWIYDQFKEEVLDNLWYFLGNSEERNGFKPWMSSDPVKVVRALTNSLHELEETGKRKGHDGLLYGNWGDSANEPGPDHTIPESWTGSGQIFTKYSNNGRKSVKFGQCWCFSGILTTSCRALGIPCRFVYCLDCAHEHVVEKSNTVDSSQHTYSLTLKLYYRDMEALNMAHREIRKKGADACFSDQLWPYHCWNEVWMKRKDLEPGYGGWQVVDSTPQEFSGAMSVNMCGPASKNAILTGKPEMDYDVAFIASEVNADVVKYLCANPEADESKGEDPGIVKIEPDNRWVGSVITTTVVGGDDIEDLVHTYKPPIEKEKEWREKYLEYYKKYHKKPSPARRMVNINVSEPHEENKLSELEITILPLSDIVYGCSVTVGLKIQNKAADPRALISTVQVLMKDHAGRGRHVLKQGTKEIQVLSHKSGMITGTINPSDYVGKFCSTLFFRVEFIVRVSNSQNSVWANHITFSLRKPKLEMKVLPLDEVTIDSPATVILEFTNPLNIPLTKCEYGIEGPGICKASHKQLGDIPPGERVQIDHPVTPWDSGQRLVVANFVSKELKDVNGIVRFVVRDKSTKQ